MVKRVDLTNGILIETPETTFTLLKEDFPSPDNPSDRFDVEQKLQVLLDNFANGAFYPIIRMQSLDPLKYNVHIFNEEPNISTGDLRHG